MSGAELRDARVTRKWHQADLAQRLGVSQAYVSLLEIESTSDSRSTDAEARISSWSSGEHVASQL